MRYYTWTCFNGHAGTVMQMPKDKTPRLCRECSLKGKKVPIEIVRFPSPRYVDPGNPGSVEWIELESQRRMKANAEKSAYTEDFNRQVQR